MKNLPWFEANDAMHNTLLESITLECKKRTCLLSNNFVLFLIYNMKWHIMVSFLVLGLLILTVLPGMPNVEMSLTNFP